jgi:hypothetical protein
MGPASYSGTRTPDRVTAQEGTTLCSTWIAPDFPLRRGVQARARASRELSRPVTPVWVTGQSGQSNLKVHTARKHRPGGPTTAGAEPDAYVGRYNAPGPAAAGLGTSGGVGPGTDVKPAHGAACCLSWRTVPGAADPGWSAHSWMEEEVHVMDMDGARRRSYEPAAVRPDPDGRSLPDHRWTGSPGLDE